LTDSQSIAAVVEAIFQVLGTKESQPTYFCTNNSLLLFKK